MSVAMLHHTSTLLSGATLVAACSLAASMIWYGRDVHERLPPDAPLLTATEKDAYVDSYVYTLKLGDCNDTDGSSTTLNKNITLSPTLIAQALYCCPAFSLERAILTLVGLPLPSCRDFRTTLGELPVGSKIGPWTATEVATNSVLLQFPGGHTYVRASWNQTTSTSSDGNENELQYVLGSNLTSSSSVLSKALLIPIHKIYSRVLCKSAARTLARFVVHL